MVEIWTNKMIKQGTRNIKFTDYITGLPIKGVALLGDKMTKNLYE